MIRDEMTAARRWCSEQPAPRSVAGRHRLAAMLLKTASQLTASCVGADARACDRCRPRWTTIDRFIDAADPRVAFLAWADDFAMHLARVHVDPVADRAAAIMRHEPLRVWRQGELSSTLGLSAASLRRQFRARFRLSTSEYVHLLRVARAIEVCRAGIKIEAVARELGYRSKKDFYAALARWTSITPASLRRLSDDDRARLRARLERAIDGERDGLARNDQRRDRRRRRARSTSTASVPPTSAAPPTSATPA
jgi:methylphosphotriester-DNA--protein-cysteine methyltransferase